MGSRLPWLCAPLLGTETEGHQGPRGQWLHQAEQVHGGGLLNSGDGRPVRRGEGAPAHPGSAHREVAPQWAGSGHARRGGMTQPCLPWEQLPESQSSLTHAGRGRRFIGAIDQ